jgi:hypothetical protein
MHDNSVHNSCQHGVIMHDNSVHNSHQHGVIMHDKIVRIHLVCMCISMKLGVHVRYKE